jgi:uncharacterized repeat protein (TIGR03843 family)
MAIDVDSFAVGEIALVGRLVQASNATLFVTVATADGPVDAVYKPIAGEAPLWDFPDGTLAYREVAAHVGARALDWELVPLTILRDGPYGLGMVQEWIETDESVDLVAWAQSRDPRLARMALFDALINNTDRKIGHLLPTADGRLLGCDHGVAFHEQYKLRTVIWQFRGEPIPDHLLADIERIPPADFTSLLDGLIAPAEIAAFLARRANLLEDGHFPMPPTDWPAVPWPPI